MSVLEATLVLAAAIVGYPMIAFLLRTYVEGRSYAHRYWRLLTIYCLGALTIVVVSFLLGISTPVVGLVALCSLGFGEYLRRRIAAKQSHL